MQTNSNHVTKKIEQHFEVDSVIQCKGPLYQKRDQKGKGGGEGIPLQEEYQGSGKIGNVVHVSFQIQDQDKAGDPLFPRHINIQYTENQ